MKIDPRLFVFVPAHGTCSVLLTLLNKEIVSQWNFPLAVLLLQQLGAVGFGFLYYFKKRQQATKSARHRSRAGVAQVESRGDGGRLAPDEKPRKNVFDEDRSGEHEERSGEGAEGKNGDREDGEVLSSDEDDGPLSRKDKAIILMWVHVTSIWALFCMFLSLRVLRVVSVPLYVVVRNCGPAATALLNFLIRQEGLSPQRVCGVLLLVVGAALFSLGDQVSGGQSTEESQGLEQAVGLTVSIALAAVLEMMALERLKKNGLDPVDVRLYTNVASLLPCLLGQWALEGGLSEAAAAELAFRGAWMSLATSLLAFVYGSADFLVLEVVGPTGIKVANISYKIATTLVGLVTHPHTESLVSWGGYLVNLQGVLLYVFESERIANTFKWLGESLMDKWWRRQGITLVLVVFFMATRTRQLACGAQEKFCWDQGTNRLSMAIDKK